MALTHWIPPDFRGGVHLFILPHAIIGPAPSFFVTQLRTDDVNCRESAGTGPVIIKVVSVTGAAFKIHHGPVVVVCIMYVITFYWYYTVAGYGSSG